MWGDIAVERVNVATSPGSRNEPEAFATTAGCWSGEEERALIMPVGKRDPLVLSGMLPRP